MVESDYLIKQHQIQILEGIIRFVIIPDRGFTVAEGIIGKVSYQSSRKGRKILKTGAFIFS